MQRTANQISFLVESQLPDFINEEYELFSKFVQKYYEQLELQGQPLDIINNIQTYRDIDFYEKNILNQSTTLSSFSQKSDTTITVADATSFPQNGGYIKIEDEICFYKQRTDTQFLEVSRGVSGNTTLGDLYHNSNFVSTIAADHVAGVSVHNISNLFLYSLVKSFEKQYLSDFPEAYLQGDVDKRTLIKNITTFYQSKGTDNSIKFLFKCLINDDPNPEIEYPREFTLKNSDSNWINVYALKAKIISGNPNDLIGKEIVQNVDGDYASAVVDNVKFSGRYDGEDLYELILAEQSVNGTFSIASKTVLTESIDASLVSGDRINVFSTCAWDKKGEFKIGNEIFTFEDKNVNQFILKSRSGTGSYPSGSEVTFGANVSGAGVNILVYGVLYGLQNNTTSPYSNPGESVEVSESGFLTNDVRIVDDQNNLRWSLSSSIPFSSNNAGLSATIAELNSDVSAIFEDETGYYISSSGFPSHDIVASNVTIPSDVQDQKLLKIIRKSPIQTTEIYETKYRDVGISLNGIPYLSYKDEEFILSGPIQEIAVDTRGNGYQKAPFVLIDSVPNLARANLAGQVVESVTLDTPGNYTSTPSVEIVSGRNGQARAIVTNGEITSIVVENAGEYYSSAPEVRITDSAGKGRFADYTAIVSTAGEITGFEKINGGSSYTSENVVVDIISAGAGATATASIKKWRKDRFNKNQSLLDSDNGYFFKNYVNSRGHGYAYYGPPVTLRANDNGSSHSPILGFAYDGNPIYGPYGFSDSVDPQSSVTRMTTSYSKNISRSLGPNVSTYPLGSFIDDYTYVDKLGSLDENNGRFCVTPEFPNGTYAYFMTVSATNVPEFPYIVGKNYYSLPLDSNYNSAISQDDLPKFARRLRTSDIPSNGSSAISKIEDVIGGSVSSATVYDSTPVYSVGSKLIVDSELTGGSDAEAEVDSVIGKNVVSLESQQTKSLLVQLKQNAYLFDGDTITQSNTGATGFIVGDVFTSNKFVLRSVTGNFNTTDTLSSNTDVVSLILDQNSSYTKGAILSLGDGLTPPVATGEILEETNSQNSVKIKILTGTFTPNDNLFLSSSNLINTTGSKIFSTTSLSSGLPIFKVDNNIALLKTANAHGVGIGENINVDIFPDDSVTTTTYYVRKRIYQETLLQTPGVERTLTDTGIGRIDILNSGEDYTQNTYNDIALVGGSGQDAKATIVVNSSGNVSEVTITDKGSGYQKFDVLTVGETSLGKTDLSTPDLQISVDHVGLSLQNAVLNVDSGIGITTDDHLIIGEEIVKVVSRTDNKITVQRAQKGTTAVDHFNSASISLYDPGYNLSVGYQLGTTTKDPVIASYDPSTQKAVFVYDYSESLSSINELALSTVFFDQSVDQRLVKFSSVSDPVIYFEFSDDNTTFIRNPIIDIKKFYKYDFDVSHSSMSDVNFNVSPSINLNLITTEKIDRGNIVDLKVGFGSRINSNNYSKKKDIQYSRYFYFDKNGIVSSEGSYFNLIDDPLQGEKTPLYVTPDSIAYSTTTKAPHDGSGTIVYTTKSNFSVGKINTVKITNIGGNYKKIPIVRGAVPAVPAQAVATIKDGRIFSVTVTDGGSDYVNPIIVVDGNAKLSAVVDSGRITGVTIDNFGSGYTDIPNITIAESELDCFLNSIDIGTPRNTKVIANGGGFYNDQTLRSSFRSNYIFTVSSFAKGAFIVGETIIQKIGSKEVARARVSSWREGSNILSVDRVTGIFREGITITGLSRSKTAVLDSINYTEFSSSIRSYYDNMGYYQSDYGKLSDSNQRIHDSFYYQDYSYLIKSKTPINVWRDLIKETTHPAGFKLFGEIDIETSSHARMSDNAFTKGTSVIQLWNSEVNKVTVESTRKNITQNIVLMKNLNIEKGVGSVSVNTTNNSEIRAKEVFLNAEFDGSFSDRGNLTGTTVFNMVDSNGNSVKPYNNQSLTITLDAIIQEPGISYTIQDDKITFAEPPLGPSVKDGQTVPGVTFYGRLFEFKTNSLNQKYLRKIRNIFQRSGTWIDAANQLGRNRRFIQSETLGYVKEKHPTLTWGTLESKCYRDIGLIIDALEHDLRFGGNQKTIFAVESYFRHGVLDYISGEIEATIDAFAFVARLSKLAMRNWDFIDRQTSWTLGTNEITVSDTDNITVGMRISSGRSFPSDTKVTEIINNRTIRVNNNSLLQGDNNQMTFIWSGINTGFFVDAAELIEKNRDVMISSTIDAIDAEYPGLNANNYPSKCSRDLGLLIDAVKSCLIYGGNRKIVEFGESYFVNSELTFINNELTQTLFAHKHLRDQMILAMRNQGAVTDSNVTSDNVNPECAEVESSITTYIDIVENLLEGGPNRVAIVEANENSRGNWTTLRSYSNINILPDPELVSGVFKECEEVASAIDSLYENIRETLITGEGTSAVSYADYIDNENKIFELYYEDGTPLDTDLNEDLFIGLNGVLQHDSAYYIDRTAVPNKVVFASPPIWAQGENTKTVQEPLAVEKFFAHSVGNYTRCEIDTSGILKGSPGPFLIIESETDKVNSINDPRFAYVFIDGILQREGISYVITGPSIRFTRNIFIDNNVEIILLYGRDIDQTITLYDFERNSYYNKLTLTCDAGSANDFTDWKSWYGNSYDGYQVAYQKVNGTKRFIGSVKGYTTTNQSLIITFAGINPNLDNSSIFFSGTSDYNDEYELDFTTNIISISRDEDQNYKMQRNSTKWLYGTKLAEESFYERKKLLANLNAGDIIKISGEDEFRTVTELPQFVSPKNYIPGADVSNSFFGSITTTNYSGDTKGVGLSVTCSISNGSVSSLEWNRKDLQLLYDEGIIQPTTAYGYETPPILHFIPVDQQGGGARAEVIVSRGQIIDIVLVNAGSGYTKSPKVVTARQYDLIKQRGRKFDSFVTLKIRSQIEQQSPVQATSSFQFSQDFDSTSTFVLSSAVSVDSEFGLEIYKNLNFASTFTVSQEIVYDRIRSQQSIASPTSQQNTNIIVTLELDQIIDSQPSLTFSIEDRYVLPTSIGTITYTFDQYESAKFMNTGDILSTGGVPVSKVTLEELAYFDINSDGSLDDPDRQFILAYPSINNYITQLDTDDLPAEGGTGYLPTGAVVYADTTNFASAGTILIGKEQISYTDKVGDRFIDCTRGVNGSPITSHAIGDYIRNAL